MSNEKEAKLKALKLTLDKLDKAYGKGTVMRMSDSPIQDVEAIPSGSLGLDIALGVGGYPRGRVIEIYGPESSGKTTLTLHAIAEAQKAGGIAAFIDAEHAFDRFYAENLGIDIDNLIISQPDNGEQALEIADNLIRSGAIDIVVIDSVAALTPKSEIEGEMGDSKMGLHARLMSQALRKLTASISKTNCTVIFINQLREKIGVMFGNPETTTGGNALKFYASVRLDIRRSTQIKDSNGNWKDKDFTHTFFPDAWSWSRIKSEITGAYQAAPASTPGLWSGRSPSGVLVNGRIDANGKITSAYPVLEL